MAATSVPIALAALLAASAIGVTLLLADADTPAGDSASFHVIVIGPDGVVWNGTTSVANATALSALLAAAETGAFEVTIENQAAFGACGQYVRAIDGTTATASRGWIYETRDADGPWTWGDRSADCYPLLAGQQLRWRWSEEA